MTEHSISTHSHYCGVCNQEFTFSRRAHLQHSVNQNRPQMVRSQVAFTQNLTPTPIQQTVTTTRQSLLPSQSTVVRQVSGPVVQTPPILSTPIVQNTAPIIQHTAPIVQHTAPIVSQPILRQPVHTIKKEELEYVDCADPGCDQCLKKEVNVQITDHNNNILAQSMTQKRERNLSLTPQ